MPHSRHGSPCDQQGPEGVVSGDWWHNFGDFELLSGQIRRLLVLSTRGLYGPNQWGLDVQDREANPIGEKISMTSLASMSGFFGTVWFVALIGVLSFGAGMMFKTAFLKLITGGKYNS